MDNDNNIVPFWFNHIVVTSAGEQIKIGWKVWQTSSKLLWSARPVLDSLGFCSTKTVAKILSQMKQDVTSSLDILGLTWEDSIIPSRHAQQRRGQPLSDHHQQYWCVSTEVVLILLCRMSSTRQTQDRKNKAEAILTGLLERVGHGLLDGMQAQLANLPPQAGPPCDRHRPGQCLHVGILHRLGELHHGRELGGILVSLFGQAHICAKAKWVLQHTTTMCATTFFQNVNPEKLKDHCQAEDLMQGPKKRRRIDEDYKAQQSASSSSAVGSGYQDLAKLPTSTVAPFFHEHMLAYLYAASESFTQGLNFSLQTDGGRVGKPATLTYFFFLWCLETNAAAALPPQVLNLALKISRTCLGRWEFCYKQCPHLQQLPTHSFLLHFVWLISGCPFFLGHANGHFLFPLPCQ